MKALTISQPYASLIADGEKWVENRTWSTPYRGLLAIHAGKGQQYMTLRQMQAGRLPSGKIIAVANLVGCIEKTQVDYYAPMHGLGGEIHDYLGRRSYRELSAHEHTEGPWCWILASVYKLPDPIPFRGAQGLWSVPKEIVASIRRQQENEAKAILEENRIR